MCRKNEKEQSAALKTKGKQKNMKMQKPLGEENRQPAA